MRETNAGDAGMGKVGAEATAANAELRVDAANAQPADLNLIVVDRSRDDQHFGCTVSSPWLDEFRDGVTEDWDLPAAAGAIVDTCLQEFSAKGVDPESRMLSLRGAGDELWEDAAPPAFKRAIEALPPERLQRIHISSQERNIPWELMVPDFDPGEEPLGVRYAISRWFDDRALRAPGQPADEARVAAPKNQPPLTHAAAEAKLVCGKLRGRTLANVGSAAAIASELEGWRGTVLHFVCHGVNGPPQALRLDRRARLTARQVTGMKRQLKPVWEGTAPVVFLNACEAGRAEPTLAGSGGLVRSWVNVGAGAVIAPLWSVRDKVAHDVAVEFYNRVSAEPTTPYAEIIRDVRATAYSKNEDSYAAYCYFGSPLAAAA